jgi:hypothetical protein
LKEDNAVAKNNEWAQIQPPWNDLPGVFTDVSLQLPEYIHLDEWVELVRRLVRREDSIRWWIGDALNHGEFAFGEEYYQVFDGTDFEEGTLNNYKYVAGRIPELMRDPEVNWTIYRELASIIDTDLQLSLLSEAKLDRLTARDIAKRKRDMEDKGQNRDMDTCPCCHGSGVVSVGKKESLQALLEEFNVPDEFPG